MPKRDFKLYLDDIYYSCNKILKYTKELEFKDFNKDGKSIDAVVRNLEIIGEAGKNLPAKLRKNYKQMPWKELIGMRNKVTHEYFGVDNAILWKTIQEDIPKLKKEINRIRKDSKLQALF